MLIKGPFTCLLQNSGRFLLPETQLSWQAAFWFLSRKVSFTLHSVTKVMPVLMQTPLWSTQRFTVKVYTKQSGISTICTVSICPQRKQKENPNCLCAHTPMSKRNLNLHFWFSERTFQRVSSSFLPLREALEGKHQPSISGKKTFSYFFLPSMQQPCCWQFQKNFKIYSFLAKIVFNRHLTEPRNSQGSSELECSARSAADAAGTSGRRPARFWVFQRMRTPKPPKGTRPSISLLSR